MNAQEFVKALKVVACRSVPDSLIAELERSSGRSSRAETETLGEWVRNLSDEDKRNVRRIAELAASHALYNVLLVLDGLLAIEPVGNKGSIEVFYRNPHGVTRLNNPDAEELSALFKVVE